VSYGKVHEVAHDVIIKNDIENERTQRRPAHKPRQVQDDEAPCAPL
jgi:hypothetical protein